MRDLETDEIDKYADRLSSSEAVVLISFLDWLELESSYTVTGIDEYGWEYIVPNMEELFCEFYGIDREKALRQRDAIFLRMKGIKEVLEG